MPNTTPTAGHVQYQAPTTATQARATTAEPQTMTQIKIDCYKHPLPATPEQQLINTSHSTMPELVDTKMTKAGLLLSLLSSKHNLDANDEEMVDFSTALESGMATMAETSSTLVEKLMLNTDHGSHWWKCRQPPLRSIHTSAQF